MSFLSAYSKTGRLEAGFVNNPKDRGGPTNHGITEKTARANGYLGRMEDMPTEEATRIAKVSFWDVMHLDRIDAISTVIAAEIFDSGFLSGYHYPPRWLQQWLNAFNQEQDMYQDLIVDGVLGPITASCLATFLSIRKGGGERVMLKALNCSQGAYLLEITEQRKANEEFVYGWLQNRVEI